ncbi:MAG: hypothetical protein QG622_3354 [Actinomycetota bacterium]|nr:hypothetical protein [Actinomycetota bacterium]
MLRALDASCLVTVGSRTATNVPCVPAVGSTSVGVLIPVCPHVLAGVTTVWWPGGGAGGKKCGDTTMIGVDEALAAELVAMATEQRERIQLSASEDPGDRLTWREMTVRHAERLAMILAEEGWPAEDMVGPEAALAAWLVAQHADQQLDVQRRAFALMSAAVNEDRASRYHLAFLQDRLLVNSGQPQIYGTQIAAIRDGRPVPWPCEDGDHLDERRAEVGIPPL